MNKDINSVAVLGSGTMGAGIAALAADNNCKVLLLDISEDVVKKGKERIINEKKPLLSDLKKINNVEIGTFENDFHKIKNYDWICEVVVEEINIKRDIFKKIEEHRNANSIVSSNTSGIPLKDIFSTIPQPIPLQLLHKTLALGFLPLPRPQLTHKYQQGHLLLIAGSHRYAGASILSSNGAKASGVGMLSVAVPESLKPLLVGKIPDGLVIDCPVSEKGVIASLPPLATDFASYDIIACGPGLTRDATEVVTRVLEAKCPLVLDADALNILAQLGTVNRLSKRQNATVLTPHLGEFKSLFPDIHNPEKDRITATKQAASQSGAIILLKGARTIIANPQGKIWIIPESTPALARGGSGDVLTGLIGGLLAQNKTTNHPLEEMVATAAWWHAQAAILAAKERSELGVDAGTLSQYLHTIF